MVARIAGRGAALSERKALTPILSREERERGISRIAEARNHGWLGEADGLQISLAGARQKLDQLDQMTAARSTSVHLGMPTFPQIAGRSTTIQTPVR